MLLRARITILTPHQSIKIAFSNVIVGAHFQLKKPIASPSFKIFSPGFRPVDQRYHGPLNGAEVTTSSCASSQATTTRTTCHATMICRFNRPIKLKVLHFYMWIRSVVLSAIIFSHPSLQQLNFELSCMFLGARITIFTLQKLIKMFFFQRH